MKYVRFIFGSKVLKYERHLTYFQFLIYRKFIESSLEDLNCTRVTKLAQEQIKKNWMDKKLFSISIAKDFFVHCPDSERQYALVLKETTYVLIDFSYFLANI